jgi:hypothetical protein
MFLVHTNSDSAKKVKHVTFTLISTYGTTMVLYKEGVNGMVDEKVTVILSVVHMYIPRPRWKLRIGIRV